MPVLLSENERAALREEVRREVKEEFRLEDRMRRRRHLMVSIVVYAVFVGIPALFLLAALAKTGLMDVPFLSARLYHPVAPTRVVAPLVGSSADVVWREAIASAKRDTATGNVTISMNEVDLTTVVRAGLAAQVESLPFKTDEAQVALEDGHAELFFFTERDGRQVPVRLSFVPGVDSRSTLSMEVTEAKLGGEDMPVFIRDSMAKLLNSFLRNEFSSKMPPGFIWRRVTIGHDLLSVVFTAPQ